MDNNYRRLSATKQQYKELLHQAQGFLEAQLLDSRASFVCEACDSTGVDTLNAAIQPLHKECGFIPWQKEALQMLERDMGYQILKRLQSIEAYKNTFDCHLCGACCRMASTDADYATMRERAAQGDGFAQQFLSVFIPYASREKAREKAPEMVAAVLVEAAEETAGQETIFFYHCPYVGEDNRCTVYGTDKRPGICQSYPETPLAFVPQQCAWQPWKQETHQETLLAHAVLQWSEQITQRLKLALNQALPQS